MTQPRLLSMDEFQAKYSRAKSVPMYNSVSESKIPHPWWDLDKDSIRKILKDISGTINSVMATSNSLDRELEHLKNTTKSLEMVQGSSSTKVLLAGVQGAGKSLLINALFDSDTLSLTGSEGHACTSSVIKYAYAPGDMFSAEVKFLSAEVIDEIINEHIRSYQDNFNDFEDSDDENALGTGPSQQHRKDNRYKKTAENFFDTIFGSRDEFMSAWSSSPVNTGEFKALCELQCQEAIIKSGSNGLLPARFTKTTPAELLEVIKPFLSTVKNELCLWPIVDCITIRFNNPLLQQGLEIIDLPGLGDVNLSRARHIDQVKDDVDVELILADTDRIGTNEMVISLARAAALNHGASRVKIIATKIDILSDHQLGQYTDARYDEVNQHLKSIGKTLAAVEEEEDDEDVDTKILCINRYKTYLERYKRAAVIRNRADDISRELSATLHGSSREQSIQIFHTSTAEYLGWIKSNKILFSSQPALAVEATGVPAIRQYLFNIPTSQNLRDYVHHIEYTLPSFVEKLNRVVTQSDRDIGFRTIARDFNQLRYNFLASLKEQIKLHYLKCCKKSIKAITVNSDAFKKEINNLVQNAWLKMTCAAFTKVLKGRGIVYEGTSKAKGLEKTVNWNTELSRVMDSGFSNWHNTHTKDLNVLKVAAISNLCLLYGETLTLINDSGANMMTAEKTKNHWKRYRHRMEVKMRLLMDDMIEEELRMLNQVTMEGGENNIITSITADKFYDVLVTGPPLKETSSGKRVPATPVFKFRKDRLRNHFLNPNSHFVDRLVEEFQKQLESNMNALIDRHFERLDKMLDDFNQWLINHAPVDYVITPAGQAIREELKLRIPYIEDKARELKKLLPMHIKEENEPSLAMEDALDDPNNNNKVQNLSYFVKKAKKQSKRSMAPAMGPNKKIKREIL